MCAMLLLCGCMKEPTQEPQFTERLVVEGRIESGHTAVVMLSLTHPFEEHLNTEQMSDMIVRWAKVTVSNSQQSEILTGRYDDNYPTKFIYTGSQIVGQEGETYTLLVEYSGHSWSATTTIPKTTTLENISLVEIDENNFTITAQVPATDEHNHYMVEGNLNNSTYYAPSLLGIFNGEEQQREITIFRPMDLVNLANYNNYFDKQEVVYLRLCTMSDVGYTYWTYWENLIINIFNPIFPPQYNPPTNISGNAMGLWEGYGSSYYRIEWGRGADRIK